MTCAGELDSPDEDEIEAEEVNDVAEPEPDSILFLKSQRLESVNGKY